MIVRPTNVQLSSILLFLSDLVFNYNTNIGAAAPQSGSFSIFGSFVPVIGRLYPFLEFSRFGNVARTGRVPVRNREPRAMRMR